MTDETTTGGTAMAEAVQFAAGGAEDAMMKLPQDVVISDAGPCKKHVRVTIHRQAIDALIEEKYTDLMVKSPTHVPGFRVGKAPRKIIERKYSREVLSEVKTQILMASLEQLAEEQTLSPLSPPELDPGSVFIPEDGPMTYEFKIEVRPEFDLPEYKNLKVRKPTHTFTDEEVAAESRRILAPHGRIVPKEGSNVVVAMDDMMTADVVITRDGAELNRVPEIQLKVQKQLALQDGVAVDFGKQMIGAKIGDTRSVSIKLSQELNSSSLRGAEVQAAFTIKEIKTIRQPELTADLLEQFGVRNEAQFEEHVRTRLNRLMDYTQRNVARQSVLELLAKDAKWDLPQDLLTRQARKTLQRRVMEMRSAGMSDDQIVGRRRVMEQDAVRSTAAALSEHFVLQKIAEIEKIEIEDEDIDDEIDNIAEQQNETPRKVRARMERDDLMEALATELLERKALELVLATATFEEYEHNPLKRDEGEITSADADTVKDTAPELPAAPVVE